MSQSLYSFEYNEFIIFLLEVTMSAYVFPIKMAIFTFPVLAFLIFLPLLIKEYRKYGSFPLVKGIILYSFIFYLLCAYYLIMLPLPNREYVATLTTPYYQLQPFANLGRFLDQTVLNIRDPHTYLAAMKQGVFLEPVFNIFLTIPFGLYLRYYFKVSLKKTILYSFFLSLFFELTQLSGLYFYYPRPYRLADVDDLINNTLGGTIGYFLAPMAEKILPTREEINELSYEKGNRISLLRRGVAAFVDFTLISFVTFVLSLVLPQQTRQWMSDYPQIVTIFGMILYFMIFQSMLKGQTLGKKLTRLKVVKTNGKNVNLWDLVKRYTWFYLLFEVLFAGFAFFNNAFNEINQAEVYNSQLGMTYLAFVAFFGILMLVLVLILLIEHFLKHPFYYERLSKTQEINTIKRDK